MIKIFYPYYISHNASIANLVEEICRNLDKSKFRPVAFTDEEMNIDGVNLIEVPTKNFYLKMLSLLPHSLSDFDVVQTGPQYTHVLSVLLSQIQGDFKHIHTLWGPFHNPSLASRFLYRKADEVVGVSEYVLENARKKIEKTNSRAICNGVKTDIFKPAEVNEPERPIVLYVGNLVEFQRPEMMAELAERMEDVDFLIKGDGPMLSNLDSKAKKMDNLEIIKEWISLSNLVKLYNKATVFFQPSIKEGFGLVTAEAMACGTPAVAADSTANPEVVGDTGFLFEPDNLEEAEKKIRSLIENEDMRNELSEKARQRVVEKFSFSKMIEDYVQLYKELVEG